MLLFSIVSALLLETVVATNSQCTTWGSSRLQINVTSVMNETQQRFVTVDAEGTGRVAEPLVVAVDHWTEICAGMEKVAIKLIAVAPTSIVDEPPVTEVDLKNSTVAVCRGNYTLVDGLGCYKAVSSSVSWEEAQRACMREGAHLAIPDTPEKFMKMKKIRNTIGEDLWVGIHKLDGSWMTVKGQPIVVPQWDKYQPSGDGECLDLEPNGFGDYSCTLGQGYMCEIS